MLEDKLYEQLRPYQQEGVNFLLSKDKALVFDDMGLGKTLTTLTTIEMRRPKDGHFYTLILCPKGALYVWQEEIMKWLGKESLIYTGTIAKRKKLRKQFSEAHQWVYLITTYAMLNEILEDSGNIIWRNLVADEIHVAGLLSHKSQMYEKFRKASQSIRYVYLLTGTPIRQGVIDTYAPLSIIAPETFKNYWSFVNRHCITIDTPYGKSIERRPRDIAAFRETMKKYMLRRLKTDVLKELPPKQRQSILVDMDSTQETIYKDLVEELMHIQDDVMILTPNTMTMIMRLRQLLVCPKLLDPSLSYGGALETLVEMGKSLLDADRPFIVFTPFRQAIGYIKDYLMEKIVDGVQIYTISGGMAASEFAHQWQTFQNSSIKRKVLLCVIKSGASFQATTASHCFFLGYEWDFNQNAQAEDRTCRMGQLNAVNVYYLLHKGTVDEDVAQRLNDKQDASDWIIGNEEQYMNLRKRFKMR